MNIIIMTIVVVVVSQESFLLKQIYEVGFTTELVITLRLSALHLPTPQYA